MSVFKTKLKLQSVQILSDENAEVVFSIRDEVSGFAESLGIQVPFARRSQPVDHTVRQAEELLFDLLEPVMAYLAQKCQADRDQ